MKSEALVVALIVLAGAVLLTGFVYRAALAQGFLDVPNSRSSHVTPTPRGGGLSIVLSVAAALSALILMGQIEFDLFMALFGGGAGVAIVGLIDDRRAIPARVRLAVHFAAAIWAIAWLGGLPAFSVGNYTVRFGWEGYPLGALGIVWTLNLFNFMDGIDGIAASEAVFVAGGGALLAVVTGLGGGVADASIVLGAACCGFLIWNWPPAKIFMGDVGSGYLGYAIAVLAIAATRESPSALLGWLLLGGIFFVDATITFVRRLARGERIYEAHRSHAYQRLARRWQSHRRVTVLVLLVNVLWILPCTLLAAFYPRYAGWIVVAGLAPVAAAVWFAGGGRRERASTDRD